MKFLYARVSSKDQSFARQLEDIQGYDEVFKDKLSGKDTNRPALKRLLDKIRVGDSIEVHSMDRLSRSLKDLMELIDEIVAKGVTLKFLREQMTVSDNPQDKLMLHIFASFNEFNRSVIRMNQSEGIAIAKAKGVYKGRKANTEMDTAIRAELSKGTSIRNTAKLVGCANATVQKVKNQIKEELLTNQ